MTFTNDDKRRFQTPIAGKKLVFTTIVSEDSKAKTFPINGELLQYIIDAPDLTTDTTYDFVITNEDGETLYSNTGIADTVSTKVLLSAAPIPLSGTLTFTISFTTAQVATFDLYMYYR